MHPARTHRLIVTACILVLIAAPSIWLARQFHQQSLNRALIAAIKQSDADKVDSLNAAGADPNTRDTLVKPETLLQKLKNLFHPPPPDLSPTAVMVAVCTHLPNAYRIVKSLAAKGADVNARSSGYGTAMKIARDAGFTDTVKLLKRYGAKE